MFARIATPTLTDSHALMATHATTIDGMQGDRAMTWRQSASPEVDTTFDIIARRADFDALEDDWNALFERAATSAQGFQQFNWLWHWANHYVAPEDAAGLKLCILTARRDGRLVMVWPLVSERIRGITQVFWMGEPVSQYGDVLIDDLPDADQLMRRGLDHIVSNSGGDLLRLRRVRADSKVAHILGVSNATASDLRKAPYLALDSAASYVEYEQRYSGHARRNRKRLARRLGERVNVSIEMHETGETARQLAFKILDLKAEWMAARGLVSQAFRSGKMRQLFADAAGGNGGKASNCVVTVLKADDEIAAAEISFHCGGRAMLHVLVYNLKYEKAGAGVLLLEELFRRAYDRGIDTYDLLAPGDNYKLEWADGTVDVMDWAMPLSASGAAYTHIYLNRLRPRFKTALMSMPGGLRRLLSSRVQAQDSPAV